MTRSSERSDDGSGREPAPGVEPATETEQEERREAPPASGSAQAQAVPPGRPERAMRASGPPLAPERVRNADDASRRTAHASEPDIHPGGTIETALTPSGEPSMVASQLLWDGSSATSRIDQAIAEAAHENAAENAAEDSDAGSGEAEAEA
ncbi:hypothetical protein [Microtetraspora niveoalba]|uniref:hypothetical protein n=1 Tax=Microtetraspora niveoalba TaxID=46175 RepID=UPI00083085F2|nr:hypothetical protein [Microtetraspora niveoalba]